MVNAVLKHEVEEIMNRLPDTATLDDLLFALQAQAVPPEEEQALLAQERDPASPLNEALRQAAAALDSGQGVPHEQVVRRYGRGG